jgi:hypothetical protein
LDRHAANGSAIVTGDYQGIIRGLSGLIRESILAQQKEGRVMLVMYGHTKSL